MRHCSLRSTEEPFHPDVLSNSGAELDRAGQPLGDPVPSTLFRHTMATLMLEGGADLRGIQQMLGVHHSSSTDKSGCSAAIRKLQANRYAATHPGATLEAQGIRRHLQKWYQPGRTSNESRRCWKLWTWKRTQEYFREDRTWGARRTLRTAHPTTSLLSDAASNFASPPRAPLLDRSVPSTSSCPAPWSTPLSNWGYPRLKGTKHSEIIVC